MEMLGLLYNWNKQAGLWYISIWERGKMHKVPQVNLQRSLSFSYGTDGILKNDSLPFSLKKKKSNNKKEKEDK